MIKRVAKLVTALLAVSLCRCSRSQSVAQGAFTYGLRVGASHVSVVNLKQTFHGNEDMPICDLKETGFVTPSAAAVLQYRFPDSQVAIGAGISYSQTKSRVEKTSCRRTESYSLKMHHATLNVGAKVYTVKGAFAKATIGAGPCLNGTTCVKYGGTGMTNAAKMQAAERLNQCVRGRMLATAALALGYDFPTGLFVEMSYTQGLTDLLEVGVNDYGFKELRNASRHVSVGIGWMITSDGFSRRRL